MRHIFHSFVAILLITIGALADTVVPTERVTNSVRVWADLANRDGEPIGHLRPQDTATWLASVPYYYEVRLQSGEVGYVAKSYTRRVPDQPVPAVQGDLQIHFINVGQGDSSLVICPNGQTILIDAGTTSDYSPDIVQAYLLDKIEPFGSDIDTLIVTHPDADHYNLIGDVLDGISVGQSYYVGNKSDYKSQTAYNWITKEPSKSKRLRFSDFDDHATPNPDINCGAANIWILAASVNSNSSRKNALSIVLMVRYGNFEAIMTGDATHATENVVLGRYAADWLNVDVLKIGHHGSLATSTSPAWASTLAPEVAIASAGNRYGHPRKEVVDRLRPFTKDGPVHNLISGESIGRGRYRYTEAPEQERIYNTASSGTIVVVSSGSGYTITTEASVP